MRYLLFDRDDAPAEAPTVFAMMRTFELISDVAVPGRIADVFQFFGDAGNLERITPPWLNFKIVTPQPIEMRVGTLIDYRLRLRGIPLRWRSEITAWDPPVRFVDEQRRGPYRLWIHEHTFEDLGNNCTVVRDHVRYAVPGGRLVNALIVKRDLDRIFQFRREAMLEILANGSASDT